jgi:hypothetical protein
VKGSCLILASIILAPEIIFQEVLSISIPHQEIVNCLRISTILAEKTDFLVDYNKLKKDETKSKVEILSAHNSQGDFKTPRK